VTLMTQADAKAMWTEALKSEVEKLFGFAVGNAEAQPFDKAMAEMRRGFEMALRVHAAALKFTEELVKP